LDNIFECKKWHPIKFKYIVYPKNLLNQTSPLVTFKCIFLVSSFHHNIWTFMVFFPTRWKHNQLNTNNNYFSCNHILTQILKKKVKTSSITIKSSFSILSLYYVVYTKIEKEEEDINIFQIN